MKHLCRFLPPLAALCMLLAACGAQSAASVPAPASASSASAAPAEKAPTLQEIVEANAADNVFALEGAYGWRVEFTDFTGGETDGYAYALAPRDGGYDVWRTVMGADDEYFYRGGRAAVLRPGEDLAQLLALPARHYQGTMESLACGPLLYSADEAVVSEALADGVYTVVTAYTDAQSGIRQESTYLLDAETLLLHTLDSVTLSADGEKLERYFLTMDYDAEIPENEAVEAVLAPEANTAQRTLTLVWDPGTPQEETETFTAPEDAYFALVALPGYAYYLDAACTQPLPEDSGDAAAGDVVYYLGKPAA